MAMTGALAAAAILAASTVFGLIWRRRSGVLVAVRAGARGRDRQAAGHRQDTPQGAGHREARAAGPGQQGDGRRKDDRDRLDAADLGSALGRRATLVQFSTAFCAPCRATRTVLADVTGTVEGVAHIEIDAESRLELVRRLGIVRTPTVLVLDAAGRITARGSGLPRKAHVIATLGEAIGR